MQGLPLSKAREVGANVLKQAQQLAAGSQGQLPLSAAGGSAPQAQCVLLAAGQSSASSEQQQAGTRAAAGTPGMPAPAAAARQTRVAFSAKHPATGQQLSSASPPPLSPAIDWGAAVIGEEDVGSSSSQQRR
jgi:hypothetical protein